MAAKTKLPPVERKPANVDPDHKEGLVRTDMYCHHCSKNFIAELNFDIDGNHIIGCPHCGHEHCRVIKRGYITGDRWDGRNDNTIQAREIRVWKSDVLKAKTSSTAEHIRNQFLRNRWLNLGGE